MTGLIIDTSTDCALIALTNQGSITSLKNNFSSRSLLPAINSLNLTWKHLDYVAVGIGPGSYTGTRVGATAAETLAFALNKPLITFCSLKAFLPKSKSAFPIGIPAKSGKFYILDEDLSHKFVDTIHPLAPLELNPETLVSLIYNKFLNREFSLSANLIYLH